MLAGLDQNGLPDTVHSQPENRPAAGITSALRYHWKNSANRQPNAPAPNTSSGSLVILMPIAGSSPWTGNGLWQSHLV